MADAASSRVGFSLVLGSVLMPQLSFLLQCFSVVLACSKPSETLAVRGKDNKVNYWHLNEKIGPRGMFPKLARMV